MSEELPKVPASHVQSTDSELALRQVIRPPLFLIRGSTPDYGVDFMAEALTDEREATNWHLPIQLRSEGVPRLVDGGTAMSVVFKTSALNYLFRWPGRSIVVAYNASDGLLTWEWTDRIVAAPDAHARDWRGQYMVTDDPNVVLTIAFAYERAGSPLQALHFANLVEDDALGSNTDDHALLAHIRADARLAVGQIDFDTHSRELRILTRDFPHSFIAAQAQLRTGFDDLLADRPGLERSRVQNVESPAHVERLAQPTRAHRPRVEVKTCALVPRSECSDGIVGDRWRSWDVGQRFPVRSPEPQLAIGLSLHLIALLVDGAVMAPAEHGEIQERGGPAVRPVADVVALAERKLATWKSTATVAVVQRASNRWRNGPRPGADFDDLAVRVVAHHHSARVARQATGRFRGNVRAALEYGLAGRLSVRQH